jgi:hypothetical protein
VLLRHRDSVWAKLPSRELELFAIAPPNKRWSDYANHPLQQKLARQLPPQLRPFLQQKLPDYMVPSAFILLNELPLDPNGKVDRVRFRAAALATRTEATFVSPRTPTEELLAGVWAELLGMEQVGIRDNFFDLGPFVARDTGRVAHTQSLQAEISFRVFFQNATVAALAAEIDVLRSADITLQAPAIAPVTHDKPLPLSFANNACGFCINSPAAIRSTTSRSRFISRAHSTSRHSSRRSMK